ncbi:hypothetical protein [Verrucosispora sp. WMMD573]|uniref:hypothetical protein n=1 Tax=Verrucosispora sp. WMMD573 TaxID=3015149 RepID=UPI00248D0D5E|nr:hypothetical protein [Verrucosispora sp. WMMD573]WBB56954.1 hypothetical protein O7601_13280 [Verrucosispora sp. WMMD573]
MSERSERISRHSVLEPHRDAERSEVARMSERSERIIRRRAVVPHRDAERSEVAR